MPKPDTYRFGNQEFKMNVKDTQVIPLEWGGKLVVHNCIVGGAIDARFIPAIVKGIMDRMEQGPLTGSYAAMSATWQTDSFCCLPIKKLPASSSSQ